LIAAYLSTSYMLEAKQRLHRYYKLRII